jgi:hypothetical protein
MTTRGPLRSTTRISSGLRTLGKTKFKLHFPPGNSSEAKDLMMRGLHRSMVEIPSWLQTLGKSNLKPHLPSTLLPEAGDLLTCVLLNQRLCSCFGTLTPSTRLTVVFLPSRSTIEISFVSPGSEKIKYQTSLAFCAFTRSSRSGDVWLSGIGRLESLWVSRLREKQNSNFPPRKSS